MKIDGLGSPSYDSKRPRLLSGASEKYSQPFSDLYEAAQFARSDDNLVEAKRLYQEALNLSPGESTFRYNLLEISLTRGDKGAWPTAVEEAKAILKNDPDYAFAHVLLARRAIELNEFDTARQHITPLIQRAKLSFTEAVAIYACQGEIELAQNKIEQAEASLNALHWINAVDMPLTRQLESKIARAKRTNQTLVQ